MVKRAKSRDSSSSQKKQKIQKPHPFFGMVPPPPPVFPEATRPSSPLGPVFGMASLPPLSPSVFPQPVRQSSQPVGRSENWAIPTNEERNVVTTRQNLGQPALSRTSSGHWTAEDLGEHRNWVDNFIPSISRTTSDTGSADFNYNTGSGGRKKNLTRRHKLRRRRNSRKTMRTR
jgi:hypothetical protein